MALGALGGWEPLLLLALCAVIIGLWIGVLSDIKRKKFKTPAQKWQWISIVILLPIVGALIYIFWRQGNTK